MDVFFSFPPYWRLNGDRPMLKRKLLIELGSIRKKERKEKIVC
jgi:hypothetical protein